MCVCAWVHVYKRACVCACVSMRVSVRARARTATYSANTAFSDWREEVNAVRCDLFYIFKLLMVSAVLNERVPGFKLNCVKLIPATSRSMALLLACRLMLERFIHGFHASIRPHTVNIPAFPP